MLDKSFPKEIVQPHDRIDQLLKQLVQEKYDLLKESSDLKVENQTLKEDFMNIKEKLFKAQEDNRLLKQQIEH